MKKTLFFIVFAVFAVVLAFAKEGQRIEIKGQSEYYCPHCNVKLRQAYVKVGERTCRACNGRGWYGSKKYGTYTNPCNYCGGRGVVDVKAFRWVCPNCQGRFR